ncbi:hypothetical protein [Burkholderia vietnamiensis]|nr:hypothetical protein [Burkholderia vietnamiensis]
MILRPDEYDEWRHTPTVEAARSMLRRNPAEEVLAAPVVAS